MNSLNSPHWQAPKFSFNTEDQAAEWKQFYICTLDYLETLDIDPDKQDENKRGWHQIKMMFQGDDGQALQNFIDNNIIAPEDQLTSTSALKAIQSTLKEMNISGTSGMEIVLRNFRQEPNKGTHSLAIESSTSSITVSSPIHILKKLSKLCYYCMPLNTMKPEVGQGYKINPL